jgi:hypothetical protein
MLKFYNRSACHCELSQGGERDTDIDPFPRWSIKIAVNSDDQVKVI